MQNAVPVLFSASLLRVTADNRQRTAHLDREAGETRADQQGADRQSRRSAVVQLPGAAPRYARTRAGRCSVPA